MMDISSPATPAIPVFFIRTVFDLICRHMSRFLLALAITMHPVQSIQLSVENICVKSFTDDLLHSAHCLFEDIQLKHVNNYADIIKDR
jgi:hypothetical protein